MSLGTLALTQEKAEAIVDDLVHKGEARRDESNELVNRLVKRGEEERKVFQKMIHEETERAMSNLNLATSKDIKSLNSKIDALAKQLKKDG
jgi:polyhydroxyalkanoate synthesis regulator phasin